MRILQNKTFKSYSFLMISLLLIEIIFRLISKNDLFDLSFIRIIILINIISIIIGYLGSLLPKKTYMFINLGIVLIATIYSFVQLGFKNFLGVYISLNTSSQLGAVTSYIIDFMKAMKPVYYLMFIPFVLMIIFYLYNTFHKKSSNVIKLKKKCFFANEIIAIHIIFALAINIGLFNFTLSDSYNSGSYQAISNKELFKTVSNPGLCVKEFGILSFGLLDIKSKAYSIDDTESIYYAYNAPKEETDGTRYIDDTIWKTVIDEETDTIYNNLNNYYINQNITDKNEMTGLFKDKNLIVIMMESVNDLIIDEELFPNFYKLMNEGWYFENNYSPRNSCATGNNEFSALTGLYSIYNTCTSNVYLNNTYYESLFNLFNNENYITNSMHDYTDSYYYRSIIHPNMGSMTYYGANELAIDYYPEYGGWASDEDFMNAYLGIMNNNSDKFMSYLITVTSHQPYSSSSYYGDLYYEDFKDTSYSDELKRYLSKVKTLDNSLGILLNGLKEQGKLDDTVIVLFGDHYPYGLPNEVINEKLSRNLDDYETEKVPLVIYNSELTPTKYDTYTSYINFTPTLANLFDLDYDPRLYAGTDIFSSDYNNIVVFADSSWKNENAFYDASTGEIKYYKEDFSYTNDEIKEINKIIYAKINTSMLSIKYNYFDYLDKKLKDVNERNES